MLSASAAGSATSTVVRGAASLLLAAVLGVAGAADPRAVDRLLETGDCKGCDLSGADLRGRDLDGAKLRGATLRDARLAGARLRGADLRQADLRGVRLHAVDITGADLRGADLRHLDADMDLEFVTLAGVRLEGARFADGVVCGPPPANGGFGCAADSQDRTRHKGAGAP